MVGKSLESMNLYEVVVRRFDKAADLIKLDPDVRKILNRPMNEIRGVVSRPHG
jgi:hypothetical protein